MKGKHFSINPHIQCSMKNVPKKIAHKLNVETSISNRVLSWSKKSVDQKGSANKKKKKNVNRQPFDVYFPTHSRPKCIISFQSFKKLISTIQAKPHLESK